MIKLYDEEEKLTDAGCKLSTEVWDALGPIVKKYALRNVSYKDILVVVQDTIGAEFALCRIMKGIALRSKDKETMKLVISKKVVPEDAGAVTDEESERVVDVLCRMKVVVIKVVVDNRFSRTFIVYGKKSSLAQSIGVIKEQVFDYDKGLKYSYGAVE